MNLYRFIDKLRCLMTMMIKALHNNYDGTGGRAQHLREDDFRSRRIHKSQAFIRSATRKEAKISLTRQYASSANTAVAVA